MFELKLIKDELVDEEDKQQGVLFTVVFCGCGDDAAIEGEDDEIPGEASDVIDTKENIPDDAIAEEDIAHVMLSPLQQLHPCL